MIVSLCLNVSFASEAKLPITFVYYPSCKQNSSRVLRISDNRDTILFSKVMTLLHARINIMNYYEDFSRYNIFLTMQSLCLEIISVSTNLCGVSLFGSSHIQICWCHVYVYAFLSYVSAGFVFVFNVSNFRCLIMYSATRMGATPSHFAHEYI